MSRLLLIILFVGLLYGQSPVGSVGSGCALDFNGTTNYVEIPTSPSLDVGNQITMEAWIYWRGHISGCDNNIIINREINCGCCQYEIAISNTCPGVPVGTFVWFLRGPVGGTNVCAGWKDGGFLVPQNRWVHIALTYDGTTVKTYLNGILQANIPTSGTIVNSTVPLRIGARGHLGSCGTTPVCFFNGYIDEVRIWNVARTQDQIREFMCKSLTGNEPGLVAYWKFDECNGNIVSDLSPNANNGTAY